MPIFYLVIVIMTNKFHQKKYMLYTVSQKFFNDLLCSSWTPALMMIMILLLILIFVMVLPPFDSKPSIKYFLNLFIIK